MANEVIVHKGRTNTLYINLGINVSADVFTSEIRSEPNVEAPLLATWDVDFVNTGSDGKLILTLDDVTTAQISANGGFMDLKRMKGGEPVPVFDKPVEVVFRGSVTE